MKFIDMFGGVGGFRYGIEQCNKGYECVGYYEIDKYAVSVYNYQFKENYKSRDVRKVDWSKEPDFDLLCGGFPCQAFSIAGKRRGFEDTRGTLFFEIARCIKEKRPRLLLLENVKGLLSHEKGQTFATILATLDECGYDAEWYVLNSKNFGVPQNRERVFIIGHSRGQREPKILSFRKDAKEVQGVSKGETARCLRARDYKGVPSPRYHYDKGEFNLVMTLERKNWREHKEKGTTPTLKQRMGTGGNNVPMVVAQRQRDRHGKNEEKGQQFEPRDDGVTNSLTSFDKDNYIHKGKLRRLTPIECERLQGFPDNWTAKGIIHHNCKHCKDGADVMIRKGLYVCSDCFRRYRYTDCESQSAEEVVDISDTQRYKMMGNAVTTNVITAICKQITEGKG